MEERIDGIVLRFVGHRLRERKARKLLRNALEAAKDLDGLQSIMYQITEYDDYPKRVGYSISIELEIPKQKEHDGIGGKYVASYFYVRHFELNRVVNAFGKNFKSADVNVIWHEGKAPKLELKFSKELAA